MPRSARAWSAVLQARAQDLKIAVAQNALITKAASEAIDHRIAESDRLRHTVRNALQLMRKDHSRVEH